MAAPLFLAWERCRAQDQPPGAQRKEPDLDQQFSNLLFNSHATNSFPVPIAVHATSANQIWTNASNVSPQAQSNYRNTARF
jgi:hypothetical protein